MSIKRIIKDVLKRRAKNAKCILLIGPRQVGWSTLLKEIYKNANYYTFDDKVLLTNEINEPNLFLKNISIPLILDEVQYAKELFPYIKIMYD